MTVSAPSGASRDSRWVYAAVVAYAVGFLAFPPRALLIIDESQYVTQALAFARGALSLPGAAPLYPPSAMPAVSDYPLGTSLLQTPFVLLAGWRGAAALSMVALVVATLITMKWLRDEQKEPAFALLVPAFAGTLFYGRIAMSDVPSAAWIATALLALFRAQRGAGWSFTAGVLCGTSILFRETNAVLLAPLVVGAVVRRKADWRALGLGIATGVAIRLALWQMLMGDAFYVRGGGQYGFTLSSLGRNLAQYGALLMLFFPLGALLPFFYRGPRRAEMVIGFCAYLAVFLSYDYSGLESGRLKGLILVSRFLVPMLPLLAFMAADVWPRWAASLAPGSLVPRRVATIAAVGVVVAAFLVHPAVRTLERGLLPVIGAIEAVADRGVAVITNHQVTLKYLSPAYGVRPMILRSYIRPDTVPALLAKLGRLNIVLMDRDDSDMFRADAAENQRFLDGVRRACDVHRRHDDVYQGGRLHVYSIDGCRAP